MQAGATKTVTANIGYIQDVINVENQKTRQQTDEQKIIEVISVGRDVLDKFKQTDQTYIIGHDIPISVSAPIFFACKKALKAYADKRGVPLEQVELEDLFADVFEDYLFGDQSQ